MRVSGARLRQGASKRLFESEGLGSILGACEGPGVRGRPTRALQAAGAIRNRGGIAQRMVLATVALALVVGAVFATLLLTIEDARNAERSALHSQDVLIAANGLELRVLDLETGQRGFILTRQTEFLVPWQQAPRCSRRRGGRCSNSSRATRPRRRGRARSSLPHARTSTTTRCRSSTRRGGMILRRGRSPRRLRARPGSTPSAPTSRSCSKRSAAPRRRPLAQAPTPRTVPTPVAVVGIGASIALVALYAGYLTRAIVRPIRRAATLTGRLAGGDLPRGCPRPAWARSARCSGPSTSWAPLWNAVVTNWPRSPMSRPDCGGSRPGREGASPDDVLAAVAREIGQLLPADYTIICRYDVEGTEITTVGNWSRDGDSAGVPATLGVGGRNVTALVWETRRPARIIPTRPPPGLSFRTIARSASGRRSASPSTSKGTCGAS